MPKFMNLLNDAYGRLTVISLQEKTSRGYRWGCKCSCGNECIVLGEHLRSGGTRSCGCLKIERETQGQVKHGASIGNRRTATYMIWTTMRQRCENPNNRGYKNYGGRGIKVCPRWSIFENFLADMGEKPVGLSLDRMNNDGDYDRINCRWATRTEQANNTRTSYLIAFQGKVMSMAQWARELCISYATLQSRRKRGLEGADVLTGTT